MSRSPARAHGVQAFARRIVESPRFEPFMIGLIIFNALLIGLETSKEFVAQYDGWLHVGNDVILVFFIIEAALKITAVAPRWKLYFGDGWNLFDFSIIVLSLIPATGEFALVARLVRVLRVLRLVSAVPQLRLIVATLVRSIPSMGHVILLMSVIFYIYAVTGFHLFSEVDPENWGSLGGALLTLFQMVTLEGWVDVMQAAQDATPWAWIYFVSFILIGTFVVLNLFIAVVINNLEQSKLEQLEELNQPTTHEEVLAELDKTRKALQELQRKIARLT
ncbi:MAG TPA: ion transporter [Burkholderiales bacterium]|nr:ion transporter [Burkholderiales bacterium]